MIDKKLTNKILMIIAPGESVSEFKRKICLVSGRDYISDDYLYNVLYKLLKERIKNDIGLDFEMGIKKHKDGRLYIRIGAKIRREYGIKQEMIICQNLNALIERLIDIFYYKKNMDLESLYHEWEREIYIKGKRKEKTIKENASIWENFVKNSALSGMNIKEIKTHDINEYLEGVASRITEKRYNSIKGELRSIFSFAVDRGVIQQNPVNEAYTASYFRRYFVINAPRPIWEEENIKAVLAYFRENPQWHDPYYVIIRLSMFLFCRVSELIALKYDDLHEGYIFIRRSICPAPELAEENGKIRIGKKIMQERNYTKNHRKEGYIKMPLPEEAVQIIEKYHSFYPGNVYLFEENGKTLSGDKLNKKLRKICEEIKIPYCSIHKVRFGNCVIAYRNGIPIEDISMLMGHARVAQTIEYLRSRNALTREMEEKIKSVLSHITDKEK